MNLNQLPVSQTTQPFVTAMTHEEVGNPSFDLSTEFASTFSIEVHPRDTEKMANLQQILPFKTEVFVPHVGAISTDEMLAAARHLAREGFVVTPHVTARSIADRAELEHLIYRYRDEAGVKRALLLAGEQPQPVGEFHSSTQLLQSELFDQAGYTDIYLAGHPEGNPLIDPDAGSINTHSALLEKWEIAKNCDLRMALLTQFTFSHEPIISWTKELERQGVLFPIHIGLAGPARLKTLLKYAIMCGIGPSVRVLQQRGMDFTRLLRRFDSTEIVGELAQYKREHPQSMIQNLHIFPLGGILEGAEWGKTLASQALTGKDK